MWSLPLVRKLVLLGVSVGLTLTVVELGLRWMGIVYSPMTIADETQRDNRLVHLFEDENFVHDARLLWRPRADYSVFNADGYRGRLLAAARPPGQVRILAIGDSNTLGWSGPDGAHWPGFLEKELRVQLSGVVVLNAGVWGYTSFQGYHRLREALEYEPDLVLISFGANDAHYVDVPDRHFAAGFFRDNEIAAGFGRLRIGQLLVAFGDRLRGSGDGVLEPRVSLDDYRENLRRMIDAARERGSTTVLLTRPFIGTTTDPLWWKSRGPLYNAATVEVAAQANAPVVDLYTLFKDQEAYFADESHFTEDGHRRAATLIAERLRPFLYRGQ